MQNNISSPSEWTIYEFPLNERVRTFLRLEDMFDRFEYFRAGSHPLEHHAAIATLFEITEAGARADLKSDLLQELERQRQVLIALESNPNVNVEALRETLTELDQCKTRLNSMFGRLGQHLQENEWLTAIKSRLNIPGGVCEFDLPAYYSWQQLSPDIRRANIDEWYNPMTPLIAAIRIVLKLLRSSGASVTATAVNGSFTQPMGGKTYQMLQLRLSSSIRANPEFSANKYMLWVRFNPPMIGPDASSPLPPDLSFNFKLCTL